MKLIIDNEEYLTLEELEKKVNLKETSIYMRIRFGDFPAPKKFKIRQAWKKSDIEEYLEKTREKE